MKRHLLLLLLPLACSDNTRPIGCPEGTREMDGVCRANCADEGQCLISETCTEGVCLPVPDPSRPIIKTFDATPMTVNVGGSVDLEYVVLYADSVEVESIAGPTVTTVVPRSAALAGTQRVGPLQSTTTFRLTAYRGDDQESLERTVAVASSGMPLIRRFTANPPVIAPDQQATLSWEVEGANSLILIDETNPNMEDVTGETSILVMPGVTTRFRLQANGDGGTAEAMVLVTVVAAEISIDRFNVVEPEVAYDVPAVFFWTTTGAENVLVSGGNQTLSSESPFEASNGAWMVTPEVGDSGFNLSAMGPGGAAVSTLVSVTRNPPPPEVFLNLNMASPTTFKPNVGAVLVMGWSGAPSDANAQLYVNNGNSQGVGMTDAFDVSPLEETTIVNVIAVGQDGSVAELRHAAYEIVPLSPVANSELNPQDITGFAAEARFDVMGSVTGHWYEVFVPGGLELDLSFETCPANTQVEVRDPQGSVWQGTGGPCPAVRVPPQPASTTLLINVTGIAVSGGGGTYVLVPDIRLPDCGDGVVEGFETCDDGNRRANDGCDGFCAEEYLFQYEQFGTQPPPVMTNPVRLGGFRNLDGTMPRDEGYIMLPLQFPFSFFGREYSGVAIYTNGYVGFLTDFEGPDFSPHRPLDGEPPSSVVSLFGADLVVPVDPMDGGVSVEFDNSHFSVRFERMIVAENPATRLSGRITLRSDGTLLLTVQDVRTGANRDVRFQMGLQGPGGVAPIFVEACSPDCDADDLKNIGTVQFQWSSLDGGN